MLLTQLTFRLMLVTPAAGWQPGMNSGSAIRSFSGLGSHSGWVRRGSASKLTYRFAAASAQGCYKPYGKFPSLRLLCWIRRHDAQMRPGLSLNEVDGFMILGSPLVYGTTPPTSFISGIR